MADTHCVAKRWNFWLSYSKRILDHQRRAITNFLRFESKLNYNHLYSVVLPHFLECCYQAVWLRPPLARIDWHVEITSQFVSKRHAGLRSSHYEALQSELIFLVIDSSIKTATQSHCPKYQLIFLLKNIIFHKVRFNIH